MNGPADIRARPPRSVDDLNRLLHARYEALSRSYQQVARFLVQRPNETAILNVVAIAGRCGLHPSSLVRFAQVFGFSGFKELQTLYQDRLAAAGEAPAAPSGVLGDLVARDVAALRALAEAAGPDVVEAAAEVLAQADVIWLVGQGRAEPVAVLLRHGLTALRRRTALLDAGGGPAAEAMRPADVLVAAAFPPYRGETEAIAKAAAARGVPVVALTDTTLSPLARAARVTLAAPMDEFAGRCSLAAAVSAAEALLLALESR